MNTHYPNSILQHLTVEHVPSILRPEQTMAIFLQEIQVDLTELLNHKRVNQGLYQDYDEISSSILNFGLPDLTHYNPESERDRKTVKDLLQATIQAYEPRLTNISIVDQELSESEAPVRMHFKIFANLLLNKHSIQLSFASIVVPNQEQIVLRDFRGE